MRLSHLGFVCAGVVLCLFGGIWLFGSDGSGPKTPDIPCRINLEQWAGGGACDVVVEFNRTSLPDGTMIHVVVTDPVTGLVFGSRSQDIAEVVEQQSNMLPKGFAQMRATIYRDCRDMSTDWVSVGFEFR